MKASDYFSFSEYTNSEVNYEDILKRMEDYADAKLAESKLQAFGEWQLCPKCYGVGSYRIFGEYASTIADVLCDVCNGAKILAKPLVNQSLNEYNA